MNQTACTITVSNVDPNPNNVSAKMSLGLELRIAGTKGGSVLLTFKGNEDVKSMQVERAPGAPQTANLVTDMDVSQFHQVVVEYTPPSKKGKKNGANPITLTVSCDGVTKSVLDHTFNFQQSKKKASQNPQHVAPWIVDINPLLVGCALTTHAEVHDPGSDDVTLTWSYGGQGPVVHVYCNAVCPDPYYSPFDGTSPATYQDETAFVYTGPGTVTIQVSDDDEGMITDEPGWNQAVIELA
jgi:hypothetical protein